MVLDCLISGQASICHIYARLATVTAQPTATRKKTDCECFTGDTASVLIAETAMLTTPANYQRIVHMPANTSAVSMLYEARCVPFITPAKLG